MEALTLTTPEAKPSITTWKVDELHMTWAVPTISLKLLGSDGSVWWTGYTEETARTASSLIIALNKANLSTKSLQKRILETLQADFPARFAGTITGSPD